VLFYITDGVKRGLCISKAQLESKIDYLETELFYLNNLLTEAGFINAIDTLKKTVESMLLEEYLTEES